MYSTLQRLNHFASISTTFVLVLLGLISAASFLTQPVLPVDRIDVHDLVVHRGRMNRFRAKEEDFASLRFDVHTDVTPLLHAYNTKQLFVYLTASYLDDVSNLAHDVVLWDRIITRSDIKDFRAVGNATPRRSRKGRGKLSVDDAKNKYLWRNPSGTFKDVLEANITLHYSLMPYVGLVTTGVVATAEGLLAL